MPAFGFNKIEAAGDATNTVTNVTEDGKNYQINNLTQKFMLSHSDGTTKEVEIVLMEVWSNYTGNAKLTALTKKSFAVERVLG